MPSKEDFKYTRWFKKSNLTLQVLLSFTLVFGLNYISFHYHKRFDITRSRQYTLSAETIAYLKKVETPIKIIVTVSSYSMENESHDPYYNLLYLLREYEQTNPEKIKVSFIDLFQQRKSTHPLISKYNINQENHVYIISNKQQRKIAVDEFYKRNEVEVTAFIGEQVITSSILDISNQASSKVYFVTGHGEMHLYSTDPLYGLSETYNHLRERNLTVDTIDLNIANEVPSDANLLIIPSPQTPFRPEEISKLNRYISDHNGRCIILLKPLFNHGLNELLLDWGVQTDDMIIVDTTETFQTLSGDFIARHFSEHPVTKSLIDYQLTVLSNLPKPVRPDIGASSNPNQSITSLMASSSTSWAESSLHQLNKITFDSKKDLPGPISIAVLSEKNINNKIGLQIPSGKIAVFGNGDFISNMYLNLLGNKILFTNTINWCLENNYTSSIPPKKIKKILIPLSQQNITQVGLSILAIALTIGLFGFIVTIRRQR